MVPFDLQKFSSEILTGVAVFVATQVPKALRWVRDRLKPDPDFPELSTQLTRGRLDAQSDSSGEVHLTIELSSTSRYTLDLEHFQISYWQFGGAVMPPPTVQVIPPRLRLLKRTSATVTAKIRLQTADLEIIKRTAVQANNVFSSPPTQIRLSFLCVVRKLFGKYTVGLRYLDLSNVETSLSDAFMRERLQVPRQ